MKIQYGPEVVAVYDGDRLVYARDGITCRACQVWKVHVLCGRTECPQCGKPFPMTEAEVSAQLGGGAKP